CHLCLAIYKEYEIKYYLVEKDLLLREPPIFHSFYTKYENNIIYLCFNKEEYVINSSIKEILFNSRFHLIEKHILPFFEQSLCNCCKLFEYCEKSDYLFDLDYDCQSVFCTAQEKLVPSLLKYLNQIYVYHIHNTCSSCHEICLFFLNKYVRNSIDNFGDTSFLRSLRFGFSIEDMV
ncbi:7785_t:CDS:1, partial [Cetraspora pellucida]